MASNAAHDELIRVAWIRADTSAVAEVHKDGRGKCKGLCGLCCVPPGGVPRRTFPAEMRFAYVCYKM